MKNISDYILESLDKSVKFDDGLKLKINDKIYFVKQSDDTKQYIGTIESIDVEKETLMVAYDNGKYFKVPFDNIIDKISQPRKSTPAVRAKIIEYNKELQNLIKQRNNYQMEWEDEMGSKGEDEINDGNSKMNKDYDKMMNQYNKKIEALRSKIERLK